LRSYALCTLNTVMLTKTRLFIVQGLSFQLRPVLRISLCSYQMQTAPYEKNNILWDPNLSAEFGPGPLYEPTQTGIKLTSDDMQWRANPCSAGTMNVSAGTMSTRATKTSHFGDEEGSKVTGGARAGGLKCDEVKGKCQRLELLQALPSMRTTLSYLSVCLMQLFTA
jgi:hypothetical protein